LIVTFHEAAFSELERAVEFYNDESAGLGDALAAEVQSVVARIAENPDAGFLVRRAVRRRLLPRFRYSVLYSASDGRLRVLAIMHHGRDPDYWTERV
jgi:plasmid stabilization system protein ParE